MTTGGSSGDSERWLSAEEITAYLGVKRDTIYKWIRRSRFPAHKAGRLWKFRRAEIDDWVRRHPAAEPSSSLHPQHQEPPLPNGE
jgi:excisionase family DNA binding protein